VGGGCQPEWQRAQAVAALRAAAKPAPWQQPRDMRKNNRRRYQRVQW